jgi:hypothetical protein
MAGVRYTAGAIPILIALILVIWHPEPSHAQCAGPMTNLCGAGYKFCRIDPTHFEPAVDIMRAMSRAPKAPCLNFIQCGGGLREVYRIDLETISGKMDSHRQYRDVYYGRGTVVARGIGTHAMDGRQYTWERVDAQGDGCACICAIIQQGLFRSRDECKCVWDCSGKR